MHKIYKVQATSWKVPRVSGNNDSNNHIDNNTIHWEKLVILEDIQSSQIDFSHEVKKIVAWKLYSI